MFRRFAVIAAGAALSIGGAVAVALPAHASVAPDASASQRFTVRCPNGQRALITLPAGREYVVGSVVGRDASFVPYRFDYRWTDGEGQVESRSEAQAETGPIPRSAVTCRLEPTVYPDGTVFSFTVTAVIRAQERPQRGTGSVGRVDGPQRSGCADHAVLHPPCPRGHAERRMRTWNRLR